MNVNILLGAVLLLSSAMLNVKGVTKDDEMTNQAIAKVLPEEFANYKRQLKGDYGLSDAMASLSLVSRAKELAKQPTESSGEQEDRNKAYSATWRLCADIFQKTQETAVREIILEKWNSSLREDGAAVPFQVFALAYKNAWNRNLLTKDFWTLLEQTNRKKTIAAISYVLYLHGDREDVRRLTQKEESGIDVSLQEIIQNAINWMNYRLSGDTTNPGPAAAPPTFGMDDETNVGVNTDAANTGRRAEADNQVIAKVMPTEYAEYRKQLVGDNGLSDARVLISLTSKAKAFASKPAESRSQQAERNRAHHAAWHLCLLLRQNTKDKAARRLITDQWNNFSKDDDALAPFQVYALADQWDRSLLTNDFWTLLQKTKRKETASAICYALYLHGTQEDVQRLAKYRKSEKRPEFAGLMQNAINWMNYRFSGDTTTPGPAAAPPTRGY